MCVQPSKEQILIKEIHVGWIELLSHPLDELVYCVHANTMYLYDIYNFYPVTLTKRLWTDSKANNSRPLGVIQFFVPSEVGLGLVSLCDWGINSMQPLHKKNKKIGPWIPMLSVYQVINMYMYMYTLNDQVWWKREHCFLNWMRNEVIVYSTRNIQSPRHDTELHIQA